MNITIRKAQLRDIPELVKINKKFNGIDSTVESMQDAFSNKNEIVIVAANGTEAVAFICGQVRRSICYPDGYQGVITELFVYKQFRRHGIATKLIQLLEQEFAKRNVTRIELRTWRDNKKARKCYESCGYTKAKRVVYAKHKEV